MAHEITIKANGEAEAAFSLTEAWHGLGTTTPEPVSVETLFNLASLGWSVETTPLYMKNGDGTYTPMAGTNGIRRTDNGFGLGTASAKYPVFQNAQLLEIAVSVFGDAKIGETAFSLRGGQETVLSLNLGSDAIKAGKVEDAHRAYLLLGVGHTGERPIYALGTDTRVVCANTLRIAVGAGNKTLAREGVTIRHSAQQGERVAALVSALKDIKAGHTANLSALRKLVKTKLGKSERLDYFGKVVDFVLPASAPANLSTATDAEVKATLRDRRRDDLLGIILGFHGWETESNGMPGDSAYTAFQAVSDAIEHSVVSTRGTETQRAENAFMSRMNGKGDTVKQYAFALAAGATDPTVSSLAA